MDDRKARFEEIYNATYEPILGYALRQCSSPEDAADIVAETFTIAWRRFEDMPTGERARLWLYGIARRVLANHRRGESRRRLRTTELRDEIAAVSEDPVNASAIGRTFRSCPTTIGSCSVSSPGRGSTTPPLPPSSAAREEPRASDCIGRANASPERSARPEST